MSYIEIMQALEQGQKEIMKFPIHKVNSKECEAFIAARENAFNEMQKYRI